MELMIDFKCRRFSLMRDIKSLSDWLLECVDVVGMTAYGDVNIVDYPFPEREGTALSATIFLGESSITVHTYPEHGTVFINIFACKDYEVNEVISFIDQTWRVEDRKWYLFQRGVDLRTGLPQELRLVGSSTPTSKTWSKPIYRVISCVCQLLQYGARLLSKK